MQNMMTHSTAIAVPEGTKHHTTTVLAESWEAFDALTEENGWKQEQWCVDADCKQVPCATPGATVHLQKSKKLEGYASIVCFPPHEGRS